jgi:demethylmenaquinone methyltransferase/2-methoxy-6-polyprenyl-1,4-benzoquinol methylase
MGRTRSDFPLKEYYSEIFGTYDRVNRIFTFGRDTYWRRMAARVCLEREPRSVLDVCTGTGDFLFELARQAGQEIKLTGYDFSDQMLDVARKKEREFGKKRVSIPISFIQGDVADMPFADEEYDAIGITFGLRNLVYQNSSADRHLEEMNRVLGKGGALVILESSRPSNAIWRIFNTLYLRLILPYLGGLISGNLGAYRYLAESSRNYYSIGEMSVILERAGFRVEQTRPLFLGSVMLVVAEKPVEERK